MSAPTTFTATTSRSRSMSIPSSRDIGCRMPALLTKTRGAPSRSAVASNSDTTSCSRATSHRIATARAPTFRHASMVAVAASTFET
jgi:hypothetical protein